ncbi:MAG: sigma-70 family RNA polymerase sigma factor [Lachnospiraceae bacterium]|nr:sigma-70 family RNA polymerase sigma factor [Lachnospiraceae bacterium]
MQFEDICKESYSPIYNYILAKTQNIWAAEDITQEVFLIAYQNGKKFLKHEKPLAFLYVTAKNLVLEYFREAAKISPCDDMEKEGESRDLFEQICNEKSQLLDERKYKEYVMQGLTESERDLYNEYYTNKKAMKEIAGELGISETAVRMRYVRIRSKVKSIVSGLKLDEF